MKKILITNGMIFFLGILACATAACFHALEVQRDIQANLRRPPLISEVEGHKFKFYLDGLGPDYHGLVSPLPFPFELVIVGVWTASFLTNRRLIREKLVVSRRLWLVLMPVLFTLVVFLTGAVISSPLTEIIWKGSY
jgi:hypothetical protein